MCGGRSKRRVVRWLQLPDHILALIALKLNGAQDYVNFGVVCHSWRSIYVREMRPYLQHHRPLPLLMLNNEQNKDGNRFPFYSLTNNMIFDVVVPHGFSCYKYSYNIRSSHGWLVRPCCWTFKLHLFNPFLSTEIALPPLLPYKDPHNHKIIDNPPVDNFNYLIKITFSVNPLVDPCNYVVMAIFDKDKRLAYCKATDQCWTILPTNHFPFKPPTDEDLLYQYQDQPDEDEDQPGEDLLYQYQDQPEEDEDQPDEDQPDEDPPRHNPVDVIYFKHKFYLVISNGEVYVCDLVTEKEDQKVSLVASPPEYTPTTPKDSDLYKIGTWWYLVESSHHELLLVIREREIYTKGVISIYKTVRFLVFKLVMSTKEWIPMKTLGGSVVFVGQNSSYSLSPSTYSPHQCDPDSIYFTDDFQFTGEYVNYARKAKRWIARHDMGVFNLVKGTIRRDYQHASDDVMDPPPIWVEPTPLATNQTASPLCQKPPPP